MKKTLIFFTLFVVLLSACSPLANSEFRGNHEKWQMANLSHYRFGLTVSCFCAFTQRMPLAIEVKDGQVVSMAYNDGSPVPETDRPIFAQYETIAGLFNFTQDALSKADEIHVAYDSTYGYPSSVQIDFIKNAADDELYLTVASFEPLD